MVKYKKKQDFGKRKGYIMQNYTIFDSMPADARLHPTRHTDAVYPTTCFDSRQQVEARKEELRFNLQMAAGLYPWPDKTPLNARFETVGEYEGYSIHKVMFESRPGFWSTGNLYLPRPLTGKAPAILNVIGHWEEQRLTRRTDDQSTAADYPQQLANFARMGFVCLVTDMIGKVDSLQITHDYGRGEKELWQSNGLGVQLWNNIRALDLLCELEYVDVENIGVTGASGGGSQTLFLALADDRVKAMAPINMISLHMQGGCQCENAPGLRKHTDNTEMCAVLAPRPLFLSGSTGDWTKYLETVEYPAMLEAYRHFGAENVVEYIFQDADHQYNSKTRQRVYSFFARHLMGRDIQWQEQPIETGDILDLTWFRGNGHAPGYENDEEFFAASKAERMEKIRSLCECEKKKMLSWMTGISGAKAAVAECAREEICGSMMEKGALTGENGEMIPFVRMIPDNWDKKRVCLALSGQGKACLGQDKMQAMLKEGIALVSGDLFMTGETAAAQRVMDGKPVCYHKDAADNPRRYFTTFNDTDDALRTQDVALLWQLTRETGSECCLWAEGVAARAAACALPLLEKVEQAYLEKAALELEGDEAYYREFFVPGLLQLGGLSGVLKMTDAPVVFF